MAKRDSLRERVEEKLREARPPKKYRRFSELTDAFSGRPEMMSLNDFWDFASGNAMSALEVAYKRRQKELREMAEIGPPPDFLAQFQPNLPGPTQLPMPDLQSYVGPYDRGADVAQDTYDQARPVIENIYRDLGQAVERRQGEAAAEGERVRQRAADEQAALRAQSTALTTPTALGESMGGTPGAEAQAEADRALLSLQQADQAQLSQSMQASDNALSESARRDASAMRSGSLANASNNLEQILGQLNIGRAGAEQQYNKDVQQTQLANTDARNQHAMMSHQMKADALQQAQQAEDLWREQNERRASASMTSGRMQWEQNLDSRLQKNPMASEAMLSVIEGAGEGPRGKARALRMVDEMFPKGRPQKVTHPETGEEMFGGKRLNPGVIRNWILEYYDEQDRVDSQAYAMYGGDPTYLPMRALYGGR